MPINAANNTHIHFRNPSLVMSPDAPIRAWLGRSQDPRLIELPVCPSVQLDARHRPFDLSPAPTPLEHEVLLLHMVPYSHFEGGTNFLVVPVVRHFSTLREHYFHHPPSRTKTQTSAPLPL